MRKNIVIALLSLAMLLSFMYAFVQKAAAEKEREYAVASEQRAVMAEKQRVECQQAAERAQNAVADALAISEAQKAAAEKMYNKAKAQNKAKSK